MEKFLEIREAIKIAVENNASLQQRYAENICGDDYAAYYTGIFLLQDTAEALIAHREVGFSKTHLIPYIELWGILQAINIQQDVISEFHKMFVGEGIKPSTYEKYNLCYWPAVRELRDTCAGHPFKKDIPRNAPHSRAFLGRNFGSYEKLQYEKFQLGTGKPPFPNTTFPSIKLGELIDNYANEAATCLKRVEKSIQNWKPKN